MQTKISSMLDAIADRLEKKGLTREAYEIDKVADLFDDIDNCIALESDQVMPVYAKDVKMAEIEELISNLAFFLSLNQVHLDSYAKKEIPGAAEEVLKTVKWAVSNAAPIVKLRNTYESKKRINPSEALAYMQRNIPAVLKFTHGVLTYVKPILEKYLYSTNIPKTLYAIERLYKQISI